MPNQYVNKVVINDQTRIDLTGDTVTADKLMQGITAHDASGAPIVGTHEDGSGGEYHVISIDNGDGTQDIQIIDAEGAISVVPLNAAENGTYTAPAGKAYSPVTVNVAGGGGLPTASPKVVNFLDYDGTIRYSYTAAEFAALSAMPANPTHDGLTAQGWNWTLAKAKAYVAKYGKLWIGQMYITDDGKTRVYIRLEEGRTSPILGCCPNGTVDVDWGDGTAHNTLTGTSTTTVKWTPTHNYASPGNYVIKLTVTGSMGLYGSSSDNQYSGLLRYSDGSEGRNAVYRNAIQAVEIGDSVTSIGSYAFVYCYSLANVVIPDSVTSIDSYAFYGCFSLANVTIPDSVTSIGSNAFISCFSLANVTIPDSVTSIGSYAFYNCYSLASVTIPDSVTSIGNNAFYSCYSLANVTIPDSVTSIGNNAFIYCYCLAFMRFLPQTPPTVAHANAFSYLPTDCVIHVPLGTLSAYTTATNYPDPATYTYVEDPA